LLAFLYAPERINIPPAIEKMVEGPITPRTVSHWAKRLIQSTVGNITYGIPVDPARIKTCSAIKASFPGSEAIGQFNREEFPI
jgi:hypothetical protein